MFKCKLDDTMNCILDLLLHDGINKCFVVFQSVRIKPRKLKIIELYIIHVSAFKLT